MKLFLMCLLSAQVYGAQGKAGLPATLGRTSTIVGTHYGATGATVLSSLKGVSNIAVYNGSSLGSVAVSRGTSGLTCDVSTVDNFEVPASTGLVIEDVAINKVVCIRSLSFGSSLTSGVVSVSAW